MSLATPGAGMNNPHLLAFGVIFGFFDAFGIGANDVANSFSTAVNAGVYTMPQVAVLAVIFEFLGAIVAGGKVSSSIQKGVIASGNFTGKEGLLQLAMVCALMASSIWLQVANMMAWPVSTTHSIVGAVMGVGIAAFGGNGVLWDFSNCQGAQFNSAANGGTAACTAVKKISADGSSSNFNALDQIPSNGFAPIGVSWIMSPIIAGVFAATMFLITKYTILEDNAFTLLISKSSFFRALYLTPFIYALIGGLMLLFLAYKLPPTANAWFLPDIANNTNQLAAACVICAAATGLSSMIYVSYWQYRYTYKGEDFHWFEYFYFWALPTRPARAGFVPLTLKGVAPAEVDKATDNVIKAVDGGDAAAAAADPTEVAPAAAGSDGLVLRTVGTSEKPLTVEELEALNQHAVDMADAKAGGLVALIAAVPAPNMILGAVAKRVVPPEMAAAMAVAEEKGYVVREMTEDEKVWKSWKASMKVEGWFTLVMLPVRACLFGVYAGGNERVVRAHNADAPEIQTMHHIATKYDDAAELVFRQLQMITSVIASFAHGSNDVANAMGPFSTIVGVYNCNILRAGDSRISSSYPLGSCVGLVLPGSAAVSSSTAGTFVANTKLASASNGWETPTWMLAFGGISIGIGFIVYGYHLMRSLGNNLTYHSPSRGYSMELGAAVTVLLASRIGLPISSTQCITGATMAVGLVNGLRGVNWKRFSTIFLSWCVTMPTTGVAAGLLFAFIAGSPSFRSPAA